MPPVAVGQLRMTVSVFVAGVTAVTRATSPMRDTQHVARLEVDAVVDDERRRGSERGCGELVHMGPGFSCAT